MLGRSFDLCVRPASIDATFNFSTDNNVLPENICIAYLSSTLNFILPRRIKFSYRHIRLDTKQDWSYLPSHLSNCIFIWVFLLYVAEMLLCEAEHTWPALLHAGLWVVLSGLTVVCLLPCRQRCWIAIHNVILNHTGALQAFSIRHEAATKENQTSAEQLGCLVWVSTKTINTVLDLLPFCLIIDQNSRQSQCSWRKLSRIVWIIHLFFVSNGSQMFVQD